MEILIISLAAFATALLTFFSGFGLGTILMPVFALFFPVEVAIALTGIVHFSNNLFKISLIGGKADREVLIKFGIPAVAASFAGAWLLLTITKMPSILEYQIAGRNFEITPVKLTIALLLIIFSLLEIMPSVQNIRFSRSKLALGGVLSGFFGGLTGIQGAIRSAFLLKSGLDKEAFIATGVVIACLVDFSRISVYASRFKESNLQEHLILVISATLAAITGAFLGNKMLKKVTLRSIQLLVAVMLLLISIALGAGFV
ncbi:MAG TPA: sulfite exporter TauE/SafE family protein [Bacteroidales bacterium]|jgi:uncharacterized membrane protein YfcA|nr:sulfite exporter TauE/SafE family protein [Bacteroidales bacterium]